jgi:hypothetical protein
VKHPAATYATISIDSRTGPRLIGGNAMNASVSRTAATSEQLRNRLELRRSNAAARHKHRHREAAKGSGKGGRGSAVRAVIRSQLNG